MRGLGDGPVQMGILCLEILVAVAAAAGLQVPGDAVQVGLVGQAGRERGDGRLDGETDLHDLGRAGVGRRAAEPVAGGLGQERAAAHVAGDQPVAFQVRQRTADLAARGGQVPGEVALGGQLPAGSQGAAGGLVLQQGAERLLNSLHRLSVPSKPIKTNKNLKESSGKMPAGARQRSPPHLRS